MLRRTAPPLPPMRQPRAGWWATAGGLLGLTAALVFFAPAQWLARTVANATSNQVLLHEAEGTIWQGSARLVLAGGKDSRDATALPTRLHWQLRPRWLGASATLQSDCCTLTPLRLDVRYGAGGTQATFADTTVQLPSALLAGLGTPWNTLQLQGALSVSTQSVQIWLGQQRMDFQGQLHAQLRQASTRMSTVSPIGSYQVVLHGRTPGSADAAGFVLSTEPGSSLLLDGRGQWTGGRLHFSGEARATPERADALGNLLNIIGRRDGARSIITLG